MFVKVNSLISSTRNLSVLFKRNYNMKKISLQMERNPHVKNLVEEKLKKKEQQGVLNKLISKRYAKHPSVRKDKTSHYSRTTEYKEYFSQSVSPSKCSRRSWEFMY